MNTRRPPLRALLTLLCAGSCAALLIACGDGSTGTTGSGGSGGSSTASGDTSTSAASGQGGQLPNVIDGTVDGKTTTVTDAVFLFDKRNGANWLVIDMEGSAGACDRIKVNQLKQNNSVFALNITSSDPVVPGTYALGKSGTDTQVGGGFQPADPMCVAMPHATKSGSLTLTLLTANQAAGTFDVTFDNGDHITGSFGADVCAMSPFDIMNQTCVP
jgi:hypothetical protein